MKKNPMFQPLLAHWEQGAVSNAYSLLPSKLSEGILMNLGCLRELKLMALLKLIIL